MTGKWNINYSNTRIIPVKFDYYEPRSLEEALTILEKYRGEARVLAGGTDLLVQMKMGLVKPKVIVNIKKIPGLDTIEQCGDHIIIGALTRLRKLEKSEIIREKLTALYEALRWMASIQIRNLATIGGNLCNASPAADTAPPLLVYNAELHAASIHGSRWIPINKFFTGPKKTVLGPNELLLEIKIPIPPRNSGSAFIKVARTSMDLAKASVATYIEVEERVIKTVRIALGSVAPTPVRAPSVEEMVTGRELTEETARKAANRVVNDISPITDARSTAEYRRHISKIITYEALLTAFKRALEGFGK